MQTHQPEETPYREPDDHGHDGGRKQAEGQGRGQHREPRFHEPEGDAFELQKLVGQDIEVRILSIDVEKEDIVVDRRAVLEEESAKKKEERFHSLKEGDVLKGRVRSVTDFGAFLDLGGVDGLLHVADMSWKRPGPLISP